MTDTLAVPSSPSPSPSTAHRTKTCVRFFRAVLPGISSNSTRHHPIVPGRGGKSEKARARAGGHKRISAEDGDDGDDEKESSAGNRASKRKRSLVAEPKRRRTGIDSDSDVNDNRVASRSAGPPRRKGPAKFTLSEREAKAQINNAVRREHRAENPKHVVRTPAQKREVGEFLGNDIRLVFGQQIAICDALLDAPSDPIAQLLAVNAIQCQHQGLAPMLPDDNLLSQLRAIAPLLVNLSTNPLAFVVDDWISSCMLVEDTGQYLPLKTARYHLRLATVPKEDVPFLSIYINRRPADIGWATLLMLAQQTPIPHIQKAAEDVLIKYECEDTAPAVLAAMNDLDVKRLQAHIVPNADGSMTLAYGGVTIAGTPLFRLEDDLLFVKHSRWADIPAPDGPLSFRTNANIGLMEGILVNALRGLGVNTTPGGTWIPSFEPPAHLRALTNKASLPYRTDFPDGLSPALQRQVAELLDDEYNFWKKKSGASAVCVPETLQSIKDNLIDAAWTVRGNVVMMTLAEDITKEERDGRVGGIETTTAGPAIQEAAHITRLIHPDCTNNFSPRQLRQIRNSFCDLFRLTEPVERAIHLAFLARILCAMKPVLLIGWSNTIHHALTRSETRDVLSAGPDNPKANDARQTFLQGTSSPHSIATFVPTTWYRDGVVTQNEEFWQAIGIPTIVAYSTTDLSLFIPTYHFGAVKHDPRFADRLRRLLYLVASGVVEPSKAIIAENLALNGPMPHGNRDALIARLEVLRESILQHMHATGVMLELDTHKNALYSDRRVIGQIRHFNQQRKLAAVAEEDESTCTSSEDGEDEPSPRRPRYAVLAAAGDAARHRQLQHIVQDHELRTLGGLNPDPHGYIPFQMDVHSDEFSSYILGLKDGQNLSQSGKVLGRDAVRHQNQLENQARIGPWNVEAAAARRIPDESGITPLARSRNDRELTKRGDLVLRALKAVQDPQKLVNEEFDHSWRFGTCDQCNEIVIGFSQLTASNFPTLVRITYVHEILENPELSACVPVKEFASFKDTLASVSIRSLFGTEKYKKELKELLPQEYPELSKSFESPNLVYLPKTLNKRRDLWLTLAVDVLLTEHSCKEPRFMPKTAQKRDAWRGHRLSLCDWFSSRTHSKPKTLYLFACSYGDFRVIDKPRSHSARAQFYLHICGHGEAEIEEHKRHFKAGLEEKRDIARTNAPDGPRACPTQHFRQVKTLLDLPAHYSRFAWLDSRLKPKFMKR
ncbi:hypothetical protein C8J57DRAFT_1606990 [Mycena rebaudengoi]|nr:hypothetical protein C8J57DRAFT_1606990 [Mycena rebaudengoi]